MITAALFQLAVELPAAMLARCLGIDISSAVAWQRAAAGVWHPYAARTAAHCSATAPGLSEPAVEAPFLDGADQDFPLTGASGVR